MKIMVCVRQGLDGELGPFDASAYEMALRIPGGEVTLLSMGPATVEEFLRRQTRLGAKRAVLLCDRVFAGADTLATAYALSLVVKQLAPDLVLCGRQTLVGDTGQTGPMLAQLCGYALATNVTRLTPAAEVLRCETRSTGEQSVPCPAVCTVERTYILRMPGLRSKLGEVEVLTAADLGADLSRCGLQGSPTRVLRTAENHTGRRRCTFVSPMELEAVIKAGLDKGSGCVAPPLASEKPLKTVWAVGETVLPHARAIGTSVKVIPLTDAKALIEAIRAGDPDAVLWGSDDKSKQLAAQVAAQLGLGLCADCTGLETDGKVLQMVRPALSGSVIATIKSLTRPAMATVRTREQNRQDVLVAAGFGVAKEIDKVKTFTEKIDGELVTTRKMVDQGVLPYAMQVGLTGRTVAPPVYIAIGVAGAVHHIVGMQQAGTVIAVNPDPKAPIFDYADYGIVAEFADCV